MGKATADDHASQPMTPYQSLVRALSDRLVEAQRPIRILDAIKWDEAIERDFFAGGCRQLPAVDRDYYRRRPLPFDPGQKQHELAELARDVQRQLGEADGPGRLIARRCREYHDVVEMLAQRGTAAFSRISRQLYGDGHNGQASQRQLPATLAAVPPPAEQPLIDAPQAVALLSARLGELFPERPVRVKISDGIVADAAAGSDYLKIRGDARFRPCDIRLLEVHEGWVHLGTTLNGQCQPICTFLAKGPPSSTRTQEGLAVLTELLAGASFPARLRRLSNRLQAVARARAGADFLDVFHFFLEQGCDRRESYQHTTRIFRGSLPAGAGPFAKDICYVQGLLGVLHFLGGCLAAADRDRVGLLFCGKTNLADIEELARLARDGLITPPRFLPPPFADLDGLAARIRDLAGLVIPLSRSVPQTTIG
jgi:uncharacterized protein (TIGR02421 family)